jgi:hypothetical protein
VAEEEAKGELDLDDSLPQRPERLALDSPGPVEGSRKFSKEEMHISKTTKALERINGSIKNLGLAPSGRFADIKNTEAGSVFDRDLSH